MRGNLVRFVMMLQLSSAWAQLVMKTRTHRP